MHTGAHMCTHTHTHPSYMQHILILAYCIHARAVEGVVKGWEEAGAVGLNLFELKLGKGIWGEGLCCFCGSR